MPTLIKPNIANSIGATGIRKLAGEYAMFFNHKFRLKALSAVFGLTLGSGVFADSAETSVFDFSLEDLMDVKVTSVAKRPQSISSAPSAIFVISSEDIDRSGATTIPELLRMVPGMHVGQINANKWSVSARGFGGLFANKLLVLVDGRTVYNSTFSGVLWENQDFLMEDIDRIEIIRGPGATLWGSNAVNGIINITTKNAALTKGGYVGGSVSNENESTFSARYGGELSEDVNYRVYGKFHRMPDLQAVIPGLDNSQAETERAGFRIDGVREDTVYQFSGEIFSQEGVEDVLERMLFDPLFGEWLTTDIEQNGHHLLGSITRAMEGGTEISLQGYFDHYARDQVGLIEHRNISDIDFQIRFSEWSNNRITMGGGYRIDDHHAENTPDTSFIPEHVESEIISFFVQDEISLFEDKLSLTIGSKFEHSEFSPKDIDIQPSVRVGYKLSDNGLLWGSVSRALRVYSRSERDGSLYVEALLPFTSRNPSPFPIEIITTPAGLLEPEEVMAYELGYRGHLGEHTYLDIAAYYNDYDNLRGGGEPDISTVILTPTGLVLPYQLSNQSYGLSRGVEVAAHRIMSPDWNLKLSYAYTDISGNPVGDFEFYTVPRNSVSLRSQYRLSQRQDLDLWLRYYSSMPETNIEGYTELDIHYGLEMNDHISISVVGRNLLGSEKRQYPPDYFITAPMVVQRAISLEAELRF